MLNFELKCYSAEWHWIVCQKLRDNAKPIYVDNKIILTWIKHSYETLYEYLCNTIACMKLHMNL